MHEKNDVTNKFEDDFCLVIPIYKQYPTYNEKKALKNIKEKFGDYNIKIIAPEKLLLNEYDFLKGDIIYFSKKYFKDTKSYSKLLLKKAFYDRFTDYCYMVIVQPDVWIIQDNIKLDVFTKYDYVGAPWYEGISLYYFQIRGSRFIPGLIRHFKTVYVGNGGFCLRNINACRRLLKKYWVCARCWKLNEDAFFAFFGSIDNSFKVAPISVAEQFSLEMEAEQKIKNKKIIPIGVHAWEKWYPQLLDDINDSDKGR